MNDAADRIVAPDFSGADAGLLRPAPTVGEHNTEVFRDILGLTADEIAELQQATVR